MTKTIAIALVVSLQTISVSAQSLPSMSSFMSQFDGSKQASQAQQSVSNSSDSGSVDTITKTQGCMNDLSNSFHASIVDLSKKMGAAKKGTVPLTAEQKSSLDGIQASLDEKFKPTKDTVVTRNLTQYSDEEEQVAANYIKESGSLFKSNCMGK